MKIIMPGFNGVPVLNGTSVLFKGLISLYQEILSETSNDSLLHHSLIPRSQSVRCPDIKYMCFNIR